METGKRRVYGYRKGNINYMWLFLGCLLNMPGVGNTQEEKPLNFAFIQALSFIRDKGLIEQVLESLKYKTLSVTKNADQEEQAAITLRNGHLTFWFNSSNTHVVTYTFDYCNVVLCSRDTTWQCDRYIPSPGQKSTYICLTDEYWGYECKNWGAVGWNTEIPWGYTPRGIERRIDKDGRNLQQRMTLIKTGTCLHNGGYGKNMKLTLTIINPSPNDIGMYLMGTWIRHRLPDPMGKFYLKDMYGSTEWALNVNSSHVVESDALLDVTATEEVVALADPTYEDTVATEMGYGDSNLWLEWMKFSATQVNKTNCYVCGHARPHLGTVPLILPEVDLLCLLRMYSNETSDPHTCKYWLDNYPIISGYRKLGERITIYPGEYVCHYNYNPALRVVGNFTGGYCSNYTNEYSGLVQHQIQALGDIYWICGDLKLRLKLPTEGWTGECALAKAIMPIHVVPDALQVDERPPAVASRPRVRRDEQPLGSFDPHVYLDAIGVPRGVPNEFKARDQVAAGFESLIPMVTISKTVDWVNYLYYNQQRFINYTRDALQGLSEQLGPTSTMAYQNRIALDMVLAEKGGVCKMIEGSGSCCTYIPDNTGPTGKVTQAIQKLSDLSAELKRNSGITDPWDQYFSWVTGWKQILIQIGLVIMVVLVIMVLVTSCLIPCFRKLFLKMATSATATPALAYLPVENEDLYKPTEAIPTVPLMLR